MAREFTNRFVDYGTDYDMTNQSNPPPPDDDPPNPPPNQPPSKKPQQPHGKPLLVEPKPLLHTTAIEDMIEFAVLQYLIRLVTVQMMLADPHVPAQDREDMYREFKVSSRDQTYLEVYKHRFPREAKTIRDIHQEVESYLWNRCRELGTVFLNQMLEGYPNLTGHRLTVMNSKLSELFNSKLLSISPLVGLGMDNYDMLAKKVSEVAYKVVETIPSI